MNAFDESNVPTIAPPNAQTNVLPSADAPQSPALDLNQFQERSRAAVAYPRCRIILDDNDPVDAPWLHPLLALLHKTGTLAGSYAHIIENDRGVLTRNSSKSIEAGHGDVLGNVARLADAHSKSLSDTACGYLSRLAERIRRVRRVTATRD